MSIGPLSKVNTTVRGIQLDVDRTLYWGKGIVLEFLVPDQNEITGLQSIKSMVKNFNRISLKEKGQGDGKQIIYDIADIDGTVKTVLSQNEELYLKADEVLAEVIEVSGLAPNESQVFRIICVERKMRTVFETR